MLSPPADLPEDTLLSLLAHGWGLTVTSAVYRPVGFGSHHWEVADGQGRRWFVTADELETRRRSRTESLDSAYERLGASLAAAGKLQALGHRFAVAPAPTRAGEPLVRANDGCAVALYPFVDGQSFVWGDFPTPEHRRALLDLLVAVHTAPAAVHRRVWRDDFVVPHRDGLEAILHAPDDVPDHGPYARRTATLLAEHARTVHRLLARYDELVAESRAQPSRAVLTHGEPHPSNTMRIADGWCLIDWETALVAPPERDLWTLDPGDGSVLETYARATGVTPSPSMLELYRIRWDLADIAVDVSRFRRPHTGTADDEKSWEILSRLITRLSAQDASPG